ncbi:MAG: DUF1653 domain-containing protein [Candidatus Magasanikiibacteriota bacterium]
MSTIKPGIYEHYKGNKYRVFGVGKHSETLEEFVIYEALYDNPESKLWARPINLFIDEVEYQGQKVPHFKFISDSELK